MKATFARSNSEKVDVIVLLKKMRQKDKFLHELPMLYEEADNPTIITENFNSRIRKNITGRQVVIGNNGKDTINGGKLINFCIHIMN